MNPRTNLSLAVVIIVLALTTVDAAAIPLFARKYNAPCSMCHTGDFKLNDFGGAFDQNGYQLPGTIDRTPLWNTSTAPFSLLLQDRVSALATTHTNNSVPDSNSQYFNSLVATIVAGGVIAPHVSLMSEIDFENNGNGELVAGLEYAFVTFNNIFNTDRGEYNLRLGKMRMEGLIEQTPEFYQSHYLIYDYPILISSRPQSFWLSYAQYAASANAELSFIPTAPQLTVTYSGGDVGELDLSNAHLLYSRLTSDFEIAAVPVTIGFLGIYGQQAIDPFNPQPLNNIARDFGIDFEIQQPHGGPFSLYGHFMQFNSTNVIASSAYDRPQDAGGGFLELNAVVIPEVITVQLRYDYINIDLKNTALITNTQYISNSTDITQIALIARYHFLPNTHVFIEGSTQSTASFQYNPNGTGFSSTRSALLISGGFFIGL